MQECPHRASVAPVWQGDQRFAAMCALRMTQESCPSAISEDMCPMLKQPWCGFMKSTDGLTSPFLALGHNAVDLKPTAESSELKHKTRVTQMSDGQASEGRNLDTVRFIVPKYHGGASYHQAVRSIMSSSRIQDVQYHSILQKFFFFNKGSLFEINSKPGFFSLFLKTT